VKKITGKSLAKNKKQQFAVGLYRLFTEITVPITTTIHLNRRKKNISSEHP
jgi:hypothetical protein